MRRRSRSVLLAAAICMGVALGPGLAAARVQQAPSSRVAIDVPAGFEASQLFTGFVNEAHRASIVILEMPAVAYDQLARGMTAEALAAKGVINARAIRLERADPYLYMKAEQGGPGGPFAKFMLVFRDKGVTALVTANVPKAVLDGGGLKEAEVDRILASANIAAEPAPARDLFRLGHLGPFKAAGTILGTARAYTLDGQLEPQVKGKARAVLIVAPSLDKRSVPEPEAYAEKLLGGLEGFRSPLVAERRRLTIAGLDAVELVGTAQDRDGGGEVVLYQVLLLATEGGYYRLVGQVPAAQREELLPELRRIAQTFELLP